MTLGGENKNCLITHSTFYLMVVQWLSGWTANPVPSPSPAKLPVPKTRIAQFYKRDKCKLLKCRKSKLLY